MLHQFTKLSFLFLAVLNLQACALTCEEAAKKIGLNMNEETSLYVLAQELVKKIDKTLASGECHGNTPPTLNACKAYSTSNWQAAAGVHCKSAPVVFPNKKTDPNSVEQPVVGSANDVFGQLTPIGKLKIQLQGKAQYTDYCGAAILHNHNEAGPLPNDNLKKCDDHVLKHFNVKNFDFELKAVTDGSINYTREDAPQSLRVQAGSKCTIKGMKIIGCKYLQDGASCTGDQLPPQPSEDGEEPETPEEENENSEGQPGRFIGFDGTTVDCLLRSSVAECSACCESNAGDEISYTNCNNACNAGSNTISISLE